MSHISVVKIPYFLDHSHKFIGVGWEACIPARTKPFLRQWFYVIDVTIIARLTTQVHFSGQRVICLCIANPPDFGLFGMYCLKGHLPRNATSCSSTVMSVPGIYGFGSWATNISQMSRNAASLSVACRSALVALFRNEDIEISTGSASRTWLLQALSVQFSATTFPRAAAVCHDECLQVSEGQ